MARGCGSVRWKLSTEHPWSTSNRYSARKTPPAGAGLRVRAREKLTRSESGGGRRREWVRLRSRVLEGRSQPESQYPRRDDRGRGGGVGLAHVAAGIGQDVARVEHVEQVEHHVQPDARPGRGAV